MDINVIRNDFNQVAVFTNSGIQLVGISASTLAFDAQGSMTAAAQWSADLSKRTVGTLVLKGPNGGDVDLIANNAIRSGEIAAYIEMRDEVLVQAQTQLDEIAGALARALSDRTVAGTPVTSGAQSGFDIDLGWSARRQFGALDLYRQCHRHSSARSRWCGSTTLLLCRCRIRPRTIRTTRSSASISPVGLPPS